MRRPTHVLIALVLLLLPAGMAAAQSSASFVVPRVVTLGGPPISSAGYTVAVVIGQPAVGVVNSPSYRVSGGFLRAQPQAAQEDSRIWLPVIRR